MKHLTILLNFQTMIENPLFWILIAVFVLAILLKIFLFKKVSDIMLSAIDDDEILSPDVENAQEEQFSEKYIPQGLVRNFTPPLEGKHLGILDCHGEEDIDLLCEHYRQLNQKRNLNAEELHYYSLISATLARYRICL